jgi:ABC-type transport system involved in cytochrome c biogenesis permease subunit
MSLIYGGAVLYLLSSGLFFLRTFLGLGWSLAGFITMGLALLLYTVHFVSVYLQMGRFPVGDPFGMASLMGNLLVFLFLGINLILRKNLSDFGFLVSFLGFLTTLTGIPAKRLGYPNPFYVYHILSAGVAYASLILSGTASAVKFLVERKLKTKHIEGFMMPVNLLRKMERLLINMGFIFLTLTLIFGSIWAKAHLGTHWINDPKLILTLILWLYYAFLIHMNLLKGLKPAQLSAMSLIGSLITVASLLFIRHTVS